MKLAEKIIVLRPKSVNFGIFIEERLCYKENIYVAYVQLNFNGNLMEHCSLIKNEKHKFLGKQEWSQVIDEDSYDKIWSLLRTRDKGNILLAKILFESNYLNQLKNL